MNDNYVVEADGCEKISDYEDFIFEDPNVGFFYTDFKKGIAHYHTEYPSVINEYPAVIYPKDKYDESREHANPIEYLSKKYVSVHIPVVAFEVKE
jgi:hypothetical protein